MESEAVDEKGWYHTGDLAVMRDDGHIQLVGRNKDMIIRGGENIYPAEIEEILITHESVIDAHVIGVPSKRLGEEVAAYIRVNDDNIDFEDLKNHCKQQLAYYKIPKFIKIVDEYPLTVTGKIQKFQLKKWAENDFDLDL